LSSVSAEKYDFILQENAMKRPPALKVKTERSPPRSSPPPQTPPTPHYPSPHTNSWLMNALFVLRPAKLWAFNIGHPCPSLAKGELACGKACLFQIPPFFSIPATPKSHKIYLPQD